MVFWPVQRVTVGPGALKKKLVATTCQWRFFLSLKKKSFSIKVTQNPPLLPSVSSRGVFSSLKGLPLLSPGTGDSAPHTDPMPSTRCPGSLRSRFEAHILPPTNFRAGLFLASEEFPLNSSDAFIYFKERFSYFC